MKKRNSKSLTEINPHLASEWHAIKNGNLTPNDVSVASQRKVWWLCSVEPTHEWMARISNRHYRKSRCPDCFGTIKFKPHRSFAEKHPELIKEWHPTKNNPITPYDVQYGSQKKYWWICSLGHTWEAPVLARSSGYGCRACRSLAVKRPKIVCEWYQPLNGDLTPDTVSYRSRRKVWWQCSYLHIWEASVAERSGSDARPGSKCTKCYKQISDAEHRLAAELETIFPNVLQGEKIEEKEIDILIPELKFAIEIDGARYHRNREKNDFEKNKILGKLGYKVLRLRGKNLDKISQHDIIFNCRALKLDDVKLVLQKIVLLCGGLLDRDVHAKIAAYFENKQYCNVIGYQNKVTTLSVRANKKNFRDEFPDIAKEWDFDKNYPMRPEKFTPSSGKNVGWICKKNHKWSAKISSRSNGQGCPFCKNKSIDENNCLAKLNPILAKEWHPIKNQSFDLTPENIGLGSNKKVWWLCPKSPHHEWTASPDDRNRKNLGCPFCSNRRVCEDNCLATINPELATEWHPVKNGNFTPHDITPGSHKKAYWQCNKNNSHVWRASIESRNLGMGCPYCSNRRVTNDNCLAAINPILAAEWHPTKNLNLTPYKVTRGTRKKVWWKCPQNHEYQSSVLSRSYGHGCPECAKKIKSKTALARWIAYRKKKEANMDIAN